MERKPYPSNVSDDGWTLQRAHRPRWVLMSLLLGVITCWLVACASLNTTTTPYAGTPHYPPGDPSVNPNAYYVSLSGSDSNDGRSEATAFRTINKATQLATAGQTIYVKAGDYGNEVVTFTNSGTAGNPIVLKGYQSRPQDNPQLPLFDHTSSYDPSIMPLLRGADRAIGTAISLNSRKFITVKNFQITNYQRGIVGYAAQDCIMDNIIATEFGDVNADYSGRGLVFGSQAYHNKILNSTVVNGAAENISVHGDDNIVENTRSIAADNSTAYSATDYYLIVGGNRNQIRGNYMERVGTLAHGGHGFSVKGNGEENIFENNTAKGLRESSFAVRHRGAKNNRFLNNISLGGFRGIVVRDGASNNLFAGMNLLDSTRGIVFFDSDEDEFLQFSGANNTFKDIKFRNTQNAVISFDDNLNNYKEATASGNRFENLDIDGAPNLFEVAHASYGNLVLNSKIKNVTNYAFYESPMTAANLEASFCQTTVESSGFSVTASCPQSTATPTPTSASPYACHLLDSIQQIPSGFGASYNPFTTQKELLLSYTMVLLRHPCAGAN